jgi:hypothetical protein
VTPGDTGGHRAARVAGRVLVALGLLLPTPHRHAVDGTRWCAPPFAYMAPGDPGFSRSDAEWEFDEACLERELLILLGGVSTGTVVFHLGNAPRRAARRARHDEFRRTGKWPPEGP